MSPDGGTGEPPADRPALLSLGVAHLAKRRASRSRWRANGGRSGQSAHLSTNRSAAITSVTIASHQPSSRASLASTVEPTLMADQDFGSSSFSSRTGGCSGSLARRSSSTLATSLSIGGLLASGG